MKLGFELLFYHFLGDPARRDEIYIFDGQRPSLQHECAVLGLFFKLVSVAAGVDRLGIVFNQKNKDNIILLKYYLQCTR